MNLLSIIIPLYNKGEYILDCLNSIIDCKYDFEIIIIDDGSTDNGVELVEAFSKSHPTIKIILIKQKNSGPSSARNKGVEVADSKYILFLDADDYFNKSSLGFLMDFALENEEVDMIEFDYSTSNSKVFKPQTNYKYNSNIELVKDLLNKKNIKSLVWGTLFKTQICKKISFNEGLKWGEDSCYKLDYILNSNSGIYIPVPYYVNRVLYDNTLSRQKISHEMLTSIIKYINYYEEKLQNNNVIYRDLRNRLFKTCVSHIKICRECNKKEYSDEIVLLEKKCISYIKYIKFDSYKHLIYFCFCFLLDKIFLNKEKHKNG